MNQSSSKSLSIEHPAYSFEIDLSLREDLKSCYDLVPFPLVEEEIEDFDYYLKKFPSQYKYMLAFVASKCGRNKVDDITCLLSNSRSKYSSDVWIGKEELYEALDRVLTILKKDENHSCFLQKVTSKMAPDYSSIVKVPMDLGKISRNLSDGVYKSKKHFEIDINLIVSNCLLYNAAPNHVYRFYAMSLKESSERLLADVPDILIRHRDELSEDELAEWVKKRSNLFFPKSNDPPLRFPEYTVSPLPSLYQVPVKEYPRCPPPPRYLSLT
eukprot:NODE_99_length_20944_cov_0.552746.p6 type:complete len:270 gc:universal NODE_99_length_20944_cov_0.552746:20491-19682(-)